MRQIINRGQAPGDPSADTLYNGTAKINQNFEELYSKFNGFLTALNIARVGNTFKVPPDRRWVIAGNEYTNAGEFTFTVATASAGYKRYDLLVARSTGFEKIVGTASTGVAQIPDIPNATNAVLASTYYVDGTIVDNGTNPIIGIDVVTKLSQAWLTRTFSGSNMRLSAYSASGCYELTGNPLSLDGITITGTSNQFEWDGQEFVIFRNSPNPMTLNEGIVDFLLMPFVFAGGNDFVMAPYSIAKFKRRDNKIYLLSYNVLGLDSIPTFNQILVASDNLTTEKIKQEIEGWGAIGYETNAGLKSKFIRVVAETVNVQNSIETNGGVTASSVNAPVRLIRDGNEGYDLSRFQQWIRVHRKLRFLPDDSNPIPETFAGTEYSTVNFNDSRYVNNSDAVHKSVSGWEQGTGILSTDLNAIDISCIRRFTDSTANRPFDFGTVQTFRFAPDECAQVAMNIVGGDTATRKQQSGVWSAWVFLTISDDVILKSGGNMTGLLGLGKFTIGTEPAYQQGATYFNTSINKMKIGGGTAWEVIQSS